MKKLSIVIAFIVGTASFAQAQTTNIPIAEAVLVKMYNRVNYWAGNQDKPAALDSLEAANTRFKKQLQLVTSSNKATLSYPFKALIKAGVQIVTAPDGAFRVYSWNTQTGGTMQYYRNVYQFGSGAAVYARLASYDADEMDNGVSIKSIYSISIQGKPCYLVVGIAVGSSRDIGEEVRGYTVDNDKLNEAKVIKTKSGLHSKIAFSYDAMSVVNIPYQKRPTIHYQAATQTLYIPLVDVNYKMSGKYISYHFNGSVFERVM
jgi:hypothetical protein